MVLAIVGMAGAGKSVACHFFEQHSFFKVYFGGFVLDEVRRRGLPITPSNEKKIREELRAKLGMEAIAKLALPTIKQKLEEGEKVVIDGLYSLSEYLYLKEALNDKLIVLAITAPKMVRYERLSKRPERPLSPEEAEKRDLDEIVKLEKAGPIALADYTILNDDTLDVFKQRLENFLKNTLGRYEMVNRSY